jgi:hypothetical protein
MFTKGQHVVDAWGTPFTVLEDAEGPDGLVWVEWDNSGGVQAIPAVELSAS